VVSRSSLRSPAARSPLSLPDALPIWPGRERRLEELQHILPVLGEAALERGIEFPEIAPLDRKIVDQLPERVGERQDFRRIGRRGDRKSTRLNSSHVKISYAVFCLKKK